MGGKDPEYNGRLATALSRAKHINFPKDKVEHALNGKTEDKSTFEDIIYEGYVPSFQKDMLIF